MVCIDSDLLIDFLNKDKEAIKKISLIEENEDSLSCTSINSLELIRGFMIIKDNRRLQELKVFLSHFNLYDFDFESSEIAAKIYEDLKSRGEIIEITDIMIASIAISNNETLLTRNIKHFKKIKELKMKIL